MLKKHGIIAWLFLFLFMGCSDPASNALKQYVQKDLPKIYTYYRGGQNNYSKAMSMDAVKQAFFIGEKVVPQYKKYERGLKSLNPEVEQITKLNKKGINKTSEVISALREYKNAIESRNTEKTLQTKRKAERALNELKKWHNEVEDLAYQHGIAIPKVNAPAEK